MSTPRPIIYRVTLELKDDPDTVSKVPVVAFEPDQARRIAEARYPDQTVIGIEEENRL